MASLYSEQPNLKFIIKKTVYISELPRSSGSDNQYTRCQKIMVTFIVILTLSAHSSEIKTIKQGPEKEPYFPIGMNTLVGQQKEGKKTQPHSSVRQSQ